MVALVVHEVETWAREGLRRRAVVWLMDGDDAIRCRDVTESVCRCGRRLEPRAELTRE